MPYIIDKDQKTYDLDSRLLRDRIVFVTGVIDTHVAKSVVSQLLYLETDSRNKDIHIYINSPGGEISHMFAIFDVMNYVKPDIVTVGIGSVASAGSFLLAAGTKGKRFALPNTEIMIHQPSGGAGGQVTDMEIQLNKAIKNKKILIDYYSDFTGQTSDIIRADMERDFYMSSEEALTYGLIDSIEIKRA